MFTHIQTYSTSSNVSLSNVFCKTKYFQTWDQNCLVFVILGHKFEKLLPYLKSAPTNYSKCKFLRKDKNPYIWDKKCFVVNTFRLKS